MGNLPIHIYGYNNDIHIYGYNNVIGRQGYAMLLVANVGSHAIVFKSLRFGPLTLKRNPGVFKLKRGLQHFQMSLFLRVEMLE